MFDFVSRKIPRRCAVLALALVMAGLAPSRALSVASWRGALPAAWSDQASGLALGGFDPLGYYTALQPQEGDDRYQLRWGGAYWKFRNAGNLAAFRKHPQRYAPRFGGFDPVRIAAGQGVEGHPRLFAVYGERLYLFCCHATLARFLLDPESVTSKSVLKWPKVQRSLLVAIGD